MNPDQIRFIDRLYKDLYLEESVIHHGNGNKYDKFNNIRMYLQKLEDIHNKTSNAQRHIKLLKKMYYDKYVIKPEDIPESYYRHQEELALERGYGHIETTDLHKQKYQEQILDDQKASLDVWIDYFLSEDAKVYPFWVKYWAFQGMLKLGSYNKEAGEFGRRTKNTVAPFPDLNREALSISMDLVVKMLNKENIEDKELEMLVKTGSFGKIYSYVINNILKDNKNITKRNMGIWVKYNQGSDHMPLVNSLKGYNTGWCTAGESTAKAQLTAGDFYVYYTLDENDEYKVPRIAIRMEHNKIAEIRGIAQNQNIEPEMEEAIEEKLKDFPDKAQYLKKVNDMKELTKIYKKHKNKEELTKEELTFLYEIYDQIKGFGYKKDPRIEEIINERNRKKEDLASIFNCKAEQIALNDDELREDTVYFSGNLDLPTITSAQGLKLPKILGGYLDLRGLISIDGLVLPQSVGGYLDLTCLTNAEGLILPQNIGGHLYLSGLTNAEGLILPPNINGDLYLNSLRSAETLVFPANINGILDLRRLKNGEGLVLPQNVGLSLNLYSLTNTEGLVLPQNIGVNLDINSLTNANNLVLPRNIGGHLNMSSLTSAEGLVLPQNVGNALHLSRLASAEGLIIPEPLNYNIHMQGFQITPENVQEYRNNHKK